MTCLKRLAFICFVPGIVGAAQNLATVSFNNVVLQTAEAQKSLGALQAQLAPKEEHLKALNGEVEALRKQLTADNGATGSDRTTRERSLENKQRQLQREADDFKNDSQVESEQIFQRVAQKVYAFLQTYSQQHGYTLVIERGSDANPVVWYAAANSDITEELIKAYNAQVGQALPKQEAPKSGKPLPDAPAHP